MPPAAQAPEEGVKPPYTFENFDGIEEQTDTLVKGREEALSQPPRSRKKFVALVGASLLAVAIVVGVIFAVSKPDEPNVVVQTDERNVVAQADLSKIMVTKGPNDPYRYEVYTLKNGLEVLLTQVPEADRAAASLSVRVGTWSDPEDVLGLAHFCEHAVFLGSEAFPDESAYGEWMSEHGGSYNAYTAMDSTNFFFSVQADALNETLARFAPFFISPLFKEDSLSREMLAVESEYTKSLLQDSWRFSQVRKSLANPDSAYHRFGMGNLQTLNQSDIRDRVLNFTKNHYSANVMKLVIYGREPIEELLLMAAEHFEKVPNTDVQVPEFDIFPFPDSPRNLVKMRPQTGVRKLTLAWPLTPMKTQYRTDPAGIITYLLGHESEGGVLFLLKEKGWATALGAGVTLNTESYAMLEVGIELTESGLNEVNAVIGAVFAYFRLLESVEDAELERIWDEQLGVYNIGFLFAEKADPEAFAKYMASLMHNRPADLLLSPTSMFSFDASESSKVLAQLSVDDVMVELVSPTFIDLKQVEPWYGTEFGTEVVTAEIRSAWAGSTWASPFLRLPSLNVYIPETFELLGINATEPRQVVNTTGKELATPAVESSLDSRVASELLLALFQDYFNSERYQMRLADTNVALTMAENQIQLAVSGYSSGVGPALTRALSVLKELVASDLVQLDFVREFMLRRMQDSYTSMAPYQHAVEQVQQWLVPNRFTTLEKIDVLRNLTVSDVKSFAANLTGELSLTSLAYGNVDESDALAWADEVADTLAAQAPRNGSTLPKSPVVKLSAGTTHLLQTRGVQEEDVNNVIFSFYQVGPAGDRLLSLHLLLLVSVMREPCFDMLRTKLALGYIAGCSIMTTDKVTGFTVLAQGARLDASQMDEAASAFVENFESTLVAMSEGDVATYMDALRAQIEQSPLTLASAASAAWVQISTGQYRFDRVAEDVATLNSITKESLLDFYRKYLASASFRKISVEVFGKGAAIRLPDYATNNTVLLSTDEGDIPAWQAAQDAFPLD